MSEQQSVCRPATRDEVKACVEVKEPYTAGAVPARYHPIAELPDLTMRKIVVWNDCNGPMIVRLVLPEDAAEWRDDGCFTHFVLLEEEPEGYVRQRPDYASA